MLQLIGAGIRRASASLRELVRNAAELRRESDEQGSLYGSVLARTGIYSTIPHLLCNDPDAALKETRAAISRWSTRGYDYLHWQALYAEGSSLLYAGEAMRAHELVHTSWPSMRRSMLLTLVQFVRVFSLDLRARAALAVAARATPEERRAAIADASRCARRLSREPCAWGRGLGALIEGQRQLLLDQRAPAERSLCAALEAFDSVRMALLAAVARRRLGELVGGDEGKALTAASETWMLGQGIARPDRWATWLAPVSPRGLE